MTRILLGQRIGRSAALVVGCSAVIFDPSRQKVLLTRRADNGQWCLPGGHMEPGESAEEACLREILEETGLRVRVKKLIGIYTSPDRVIQYDNNRIFQPVSFSFEAEPVSGSLVTSDETTAFGYFSPEEIKELDLMTLHDERIRDAYAHQDGALIR